MLDTKIIIILAILFFNIVFLVNQKGRIAACFNLVTTIILLILLLSFAAANQFLFKAVALLLMVFLVVCFFIVTCQNETVKNKRKIRDKSFSFGYFLLALVLTMGIFVSTSFLLTSSFEQHKQVNKTEVIKKIDVNNTQLAKEKYQSKTSLFDERSLAIKLFKGFSDLIILSVIILALGHQLILLNYKKHDL